MHCSKITFIIPTKNRPDKINNCLNNPSIKTNYIDNVIVVASGNGMKDIVLRYSEKMNVQYIHSDQYGQVVQRNLGIIYPLAAEHISLKNMIQLLLVLLVMLME